MKCLVGISLIVLITFCTPGESRAQTPAKRTPAPAAQPGPTPPASTLNRLTDATVKQLIAIGEEQSSSRRAPPTKWRPVSSCGLRMAMT
jgi:hypothetical protein